MKERKRNDNERKRKRLIKGKGKEFGFNKGKRKRIEGFADSETIGPTIAPEHTHKEPFCKLVKETVKICFLLVCS